MAKCMESSALGNWNLIWFMNHIEYACLRSYWLVDEKMLRNHGIRLNNTSNFLQLYTSRFVPLFIHLILLILVFVYRVRRFAIETLIDDKTSLMTFAIFLLYLWITSFKGWSCCELCKRSVCKCTKFERLVIQLKIQFISLMIYYHFLIYKNRSDAWTGASLGLVFIEMVLSLSGISLFRYYVVFFCKIV